jgi:LmbE family N-acetylglucosaminyl deacetylase
MKRILTILLSLGLLIIFPSTSLAKENTSLWSVCTYTCSNETRNGLRKIKDEDSGTHLVVAGPGYVTVSWDESVPASTLYIEWYTVPEGFTITQYDGNGTILSECDGSTVQINQLYPLQDGTRRVCVNSDVEMDISALQIYNADTIPYNYHDWSDSPEKLDYLIISAHPDDDVLFMGAIVPIYGVERGLTGNILYVCTKDLRLRCNEALNAAWVMGLRYYPILAGFEDVANTKKEEWGQDFTLERMTRYLVVQLRKYKPEVVVTHDPNGEYGHWQHILISEAAQQAVALANDASYDPDSAAQYGVYPVKKLYLHLYRQNSISLDVDSPLASFDGLSAFEVAKLAFEEHASQIENGYHRVRNEGVYSLSDFGLFYSAVGSDGGKNDMFENIDESLLSTYVAPTPMPTQTPVQTAQPVADEDEAVRQASIPSSMWALYLAAGILIGMPLVIVVAARIEGLLARKRSQSDTRDDMAE